MGSKRVVNFMPFILIVLFIIGFIQYQGSAMQVNAKASNRAFAAEGQVPIKFIVLSSNKNKTSINVIECPVIGARRYLGLYSMNGQWGNPGDTISSNYEWFRVYKGF